jgi:hypothetical protein
MFYFWLMVGGAAFIPNPFCVMLRETSLTVTDFNYDIEQIITF